MTMHRIALVLMLLWFSRAAIAAVDVKFSPKPNPPEAGENLLEIRLNDDAGNPLDGATVGVSIFMPAMGTMPRMEEKATVIAKNGGIYLASFELPMPGTWEITASVEKDGRKEIVHASITTSIPDVASKGARRTTDAAASGGSILMELGPERLQLIGVRFAEAKVIPMNKNIEAVGVVEQDQTHREEVTLRVSGYVVKQFRGRVGDLVEAGDPLFSMYSPDMVTAQSEFFLAENLTSGGQSLHQATTEKLKNLGLSDRDIAEIRKSGKPRRDVIIRSKVKGTILEITAREGAAINAGQVVYVIGDLTQTYIVARVFQQDVGDLKVGQPLRVSIPGASSGAVEGRVNLIYPQVEPGAGTTNVRVEIVKYLKSMRPGAYVDLRFPVDLGSLLAIPSEAILYSGKHRYVFVDRGEGALEPREIEVGRASEGLTEVTAGLNAGERVAASGTFLLGSEAQLRSALPKWRADPNSGAKK